jgi:hypothetical protein
MTKRTKICVGVLILGGFAAVILRPQAGRTGVALGFIKYANDGAAVVRLTNREPRSLRCTPLNAWMFEDEPPRKLLANFVLMPRSHTQFLVSPHPSQPDRAAVSVRCLPETSKLRQRVDQLLLKVGVNIASTGFVASVDLPSK